VLISGYFFCGFRWNPGGSLDLRFQISDFRFQISNLKSDISDFTFHISDFKFQISPLKFEIQAPRLSLLLRRNDLLRLDLPLARVIDRFGQDTRGFLRCMETHRVFREDEIGPPLCPTL